MACSHNRYDVVAPDEDSKTNAHLFHSAIPDDTHQELDEEVLSLWKEGDGTLLQVSSKVRVEGEQVSAEQRLADRMRVGTWSRIELDCDADCEVAAATTEQDKIELAAQYLVVLICGIFDHFLSCLGHM